jgi:hypothetical protein
MDKVAEIFSLSSTKYTPDRKELTMGRTVEGIG